MCIKCWDRSLNGKAQLNKRQSKFLGYGRLKKDERTQYKLDKGKDTNEPSRI